jgi:transcriptional regulator with XRE-family HTH domain
MTFPDAALTRFASNVRRLRKEAGFSQEVMADRSAVSTAMISKVENGTALPYFDVVIRMAGALSTTPSALVEGIAWKPGEIVESDPQDYTLAES